MTPPPTSSKEGASYTLSHDLIDDFVAVGVDVTEPITRIDDDAGQSEVAAVAWTDLPEDLVDPEIRARRDTDFRAAVLEIGDNPGLRR